MGLTTTEVDPLTERIIGCAIEVHRNLGPGLLESVYRECMVIELRGSHLYVESERQVPVQYKGRRIGGKLKLDLLVEDCVVVELKAVEHIHPTSQHLKLTGSRCGIFESQFDSSPGWPQTTPPGPARKKTA